jgi:alpha-amylase
MWPGDMEAILSRVGNLNTDFGFPAGARPYVYMEVIDLGMGLVTTTVHSDSLINY